MGSTAGPSAIQSLTSIASGGVADYGKLSAKDLRVDIFTRLGNRTLPFELTCEGPTLIALNTTDNRDGTEWRDEGPEFFGLGLVNGNEKLGSFYVGLEDAVADGTPARFIQSSDGGSTWTLGDTLWPGHLASVAGSSSLAPLPIRSLTLDLLVSAFIAPANTLTLSNEMPLDGSVTITVVYL